MGYKKRTIFFFHADMNDLKEFLKINKARYELNLSNKNYVLVLIICGLYTCLNILIYMKYIEKVLSM